jgi:hypothetical protein
VISGRRRLPRTDKVRFLGEVDDADRLAAIDAGLWVDDLARWRPTRTARSSGGFASRR